MPRITALTATPDNMRRAAQPGLLAYNRWTGEEYSATAGDYWDHDPRKPLVDEMGGALLLAVERTRIVFVAS